MDVLGRWLADHNTRPGPAADSGSGLLVNGPDDHTISAVAGYGFHR